MLHMAVLVRKSPRIHCYGLTYSEQVEVLTNFNNFVPFFSALYGPKYFLCPSSPFNCH